MGKGFLNAGVSGVVGLADLALTSAQLVSNSLDFGKPIYHIPDQFFTPFTIGNSQIERVSGAMGEFSFYALDAYMGASGAIRGGFEGAADAYRIARKGGGGCFVAGTLVQMADGTTKPIEQVQVGEFVQSRNPDTKQTEPKRVERTSIRQVEDILTLQFANAKTGEVEETVTTTPNHPFYVEGIGFVRAGDLAIGNSIVTRAGPALLLQNKTASSDSNGVSVYNFVIADDHTYFVGTAEGGIWVHNGNPLDCDGDPLAYITATQPVYRSTSLPKSFVITTESGSSYWVHGNATEHMAEELAKRSTYLSFEQLALYTQIQQLPSLRAAIAAAEKAGIVLGEGQVAGGWELTFSAPRGPGQLVAIKHARSSGYKE